MNVFPERNSFVSWGLTVYKENINMTWTGSNRRNVESREEGVTVFGEDFPGEKIPEWNVEGQILITHTEDKS